MQERLRQKLRSLDGKGYGSYKSIKGTYGFEGFELHIDFIQGDPFAEPSRVRATIPQSLAQIPRELFGNKVRAIAARDFLTRNFAREAKKFSRSCGSGKSGLIEIDAPSQQVLERTSAFISDKEVELRFFVGLPADGRRILATEAETMLFDLIPQCVKTAGLFANLDKAKFSRHVESVEDQVALRAQLEDKKLVAFVANGSLLPRRSGIDDRPLEGNVVPFESPPTMKVQLNTPNSGPVCGLGIPRGITVFVGGGYHGKSTLLRALEFGVYDHLPGDGREKVVCESTATKIRSEDGRSVSGVTIAPFINNLPMGQETLNFSTTNASGSTSQAAAIIEALQLGCKTLLIDEDTSATNFMIRDRRMQELIRKSCEPITPFTDKVKQLFSEQQVSTILVMGGSGDYFSLADRVIALQSYKPSEVTEAAHKIAKEFDTGRLHEGGEAFGELRPRSVISRSIDTARGRRDPHFKVRRTVELEVGEERIDCSHITQLVDPSQLRSIAHAIVDAKKSGETFSLEFNGDIDGLSQDKLGNLAAFRPQEFAAVLNRLRTLKT
jgi:predicted ABC-class ATPase